MPNELLPNPVTVPPSELADPQAVVEAFLAALADADAEIADALVADDILYVNVGLPAVRGRAQLAKVFDLFKRPGTGFEVYLHAISADGPVVLTERTDVLIFGPLRLQFWVFGRFDVHDGKITLWRDAFDYLDIGRAFVRSVAALALPGLRPTPPRSLDEPPGR